MRKLPSVSSSRNGGRGTLTHSRCHHLGRLPPRTPPKSWALKINSSGDGIGPPTLGGSAALGEATEATATGKAFRVRWYRFGNDKWIVVSPRCTMAMNSSHVDCSSTHNNHEAPVDAEAKVFPCSCGSSLFAEPMLAPYSFCFE